MDIRKWKASAPPCRATLYVAAGLLAACGGSDSPRPPDENLAVIAANGAREKAAIALVAIVRAHHDLATPFVYGVNNGGLGEVLQSLASGRCNMGGDVHVSLDGNTLREVTVLPVGRHTYAVAYSECERGGGLGGIGMHGSASVEYTRAEPDADGQNELTAAASTSGTRGWLDIRMFSEVTAYGSGQMTARWAPGRNATTWAPARGARLINNMTAGVAELDAGSYTISYSWGPESLARVLRRRRGDDQWHSLRPQRPA